MQKRGGPTILNVLIVGLVTLALVHTAGHFLLYGTGISGLAEKGISGFAVGNTDIEQLKSQYTQISFASKVIIIGEWGLLILLISASLVGDRIHVKKQKLVLQLKKTTDKSKTDIDILYDLLKENKTIPIATICETFHIKEETAHEWAKILEEAELATLHYPRFGDVELQVIK